MRHDPPETAIAAMAVLTGLAIALVMAVQFLADLLR